MNTRCTRSHFEVVIIGVETRRGVMVGLATAPRASLPALSRCVVPGMLINLDTPNAPYRWSLASLFRRERHSFRPKQNISSCPHGFVGQAL